MLYFAQFTGLWESFKRRWIVGAELDHYLPPSTHWKPKSPETNLIYRYPAPGSSSEGMKVPRSAPETVYDIAYFKRGQIKKTAFGAPEHVVAGNVQQGYGPRHQPQPYWLYHEGDLAFMRQHYLESGLIPMGVARHPHEKTHMIYDWLPADIRGMAERPVGPPAHYQN